MKQEQMKQTINFNVESILKNIINKENIKIIPIFIPHLGCNNDCVFCNQKKISGILTPARDIKEITEEIEKNLKYIVDSNNVQIAFFGGSFTGLLLEEQKLYLDVANKYIESGKVNSIRISTRPDYINEDILKFLKSNNVKTIELGVQSMDDEVLIESRRGHLSDDVKKAAKLINDYGIELGFQLMIGLPKSTKEKEIQSMKELIKFNPKYLRLYPVYVIEGSKLYNMYISKEYTSLDLEEASDRTVEVIKICLDTNVKIIRIGLQSTDEITSSNSNIYGPVCDNFGEIALSKLILPYIDDEIKKICCKSLTTNELIIKTNNKYFSIISGSNKVNKKYLENKYKIKIKFKGD